MPGNKKSHAREFLIELSQSNKVDSWLKAVIFESINSNGKISNEKLNDIYISMKEEKNIDIPQLSFVNKQDSNKITLKKLEHIKGVNALAPNQSIKFSDDVTILFGLNGAGKSSYFKVLNEIVGGNEKKEILPNIYQESKDDIQVKLSYFHTLEKELNFDNESRAISPLTNCKVFDSSYLTGLLSQRTQSETVLQPLGLHLFNYITKIMDNFKKKLQEDADNIRVKKPSISYENLSEQIKIVFQSNILSQETIKLIEGKYVFSDEKKTLLKNNQEELKTLNQTNYDDKISVLNIENQDIDGVLNFIKKKEEIEKKIIEIETLLKIKKNKEVANEEAVKKINILNEISLSRTKEWKDFISAGENLKNTQNIDEKVCVYCNQPLQDKAIQLIKAYSTSINDKSEKELRDAAKNLNDAISELKDYPVSLVVSEKFKSILELKKIENSEKSYFTSLQEAEESFKNFKVYLLAFAENKEVEKPIIIIDNKIQEWLSRKLLENSETIKKLGEDSVKKNERILLLDKNIKEFLENQAISDQKEKIASWIRATSEENQLIEKSNKINTHAVATSSSRAHDELLTDSLNSLFKDELNQLGYNNLDVEIVKAKGGKGINPTKLVLKEKNSVDIILSEGEQKAVGLALFIAETKIQKSNCPIILDDPVNSLDHKIAANFANRLLSLDNQLIIFNHNRLFQDAFETAKGSHICKTFDTQCNKQGKHILVYNVSSESKSRKGVLCFYKSNNSKIHIDEAIRELKKSPFTEHTKVAGMLRKAVECIVDEKILNGVIPTKYSNKNNRIPWDNLKNLKNDVTIIEKIRKVHDRVSGGDLHNGTESENNPIDIDEFNKMIDDLESVLNGENQ